MVKFVILEKLEIVVDRIRQPIATGFTGTELQVWISRVSAVIENKVLVASPLSWKRPPNVEITNWFIKGNDILNCVVIHNCILELVKPQYTQSLQ
jgi:hypothetical protein